MAGPPRVYDPWEPEFWEVLTDPRQWGFVDDAEIMRVYSAIHGSFLRYRRELNADGNIHSVNLTDIRAVIGLAFRMKRIPREFYKIAPNIHSLVIIVEPDCALHVGRFTSLRDLVLTDSELDAIPPAIYGLHATLRSLNMSNNNITEIPRDFGQLDLHRLTLSDNSIESLPDAPGEGLDMLRHLEILYLDGNRLDRLPDTFANLGYLMFVNLSNCDRLKYIPRPVLEAWKRNMEDPPSGPPMMFPLRAANYYLKGTAFYESLSERFPPTLGTSDGYMDEERLAIAIAREIEIERQIQRRAAFVFSNRELEDAPLAADPVRVGVTRRREDERREDATRRRLAGGGAGAGAGDAGAEPMPVPPRRSPALYADVEKLLARMAFPMGKRHKAMLEMFD